MYLNFILKKGLAKKVFDQGSSLNPAEFYWTWQFFEKTGLNEIANCCQGFSVGCDLDKGYRFKKGEQIRLNDPQFSIKLPDVKEGEEKHFVLNLFCWESDRYSTATIKKAFSNDAIKVLWGIYNERQENQRKAIDDFMDWLKNDNSDAMSAVMTVLGAATALPYIQAGLQVLPMIERAVRMIRALDADEYIGFHEMDFYYKRQGDGYVYSWAFDKEMPIVKDKESDLVHQDLTFRQDNGKNRIVGRVATRVQFEI